MIQPTLVPFGCCLLVRSRIAQSRVRIVRSGASTATSDAQVEQVDVVEGRPEDLLTEPVVMSLSCALFEEDGCTVHVGEEFLHFYLVFFPNDRRLWCDGSDPMSTIHPNNFAIVIGSMV